MAEKNEYDVVVVGSGPNGLTAANLCADAGLQTLVIEGADQIGGGLRSGELTLPGFVHDHCSAVHPTGYLSPVFRSLELEQFGLEWCLPEASAAHPLEGRDAALLYPEVARTLETIGADAASYQRLTDWLLPDFGELIADLLNPLSLPNRPLSLAKFGIPALLPARFLARRVFEGEAARALFAGCAAHSILPLEMFGTAAVGLVFLLSGHVSAWPVAKGGSQLIASALSQRFQSRGGLVETGRWIERFEELPKARRYLLDLSPDQVRRICSGRLSSRYMERLGRFTYGPGVYKVDYALASPIPWSDPACLEASTVHVGGTLDEICGSERDAWEGRVSDRPFVMVCQQSHFDASRAPKGQHTGYAYCHVPNGCKESMEDAIDSQIERFAPGFRDCILKKVTTNPSQMQAYNPSYLGGAITGGAAHLGQLATRPTVSANPYRTSDPSIYLCSHSTPPGGGVHGMCGAAAARRVIKSLGLSV